MADFPRKLEYKLLERSNSDALRELQAVSKKVDFVSNDYLGMAKDEGVFHGAYRLLLDRGIIQNGATGSRLLSGNDELYMEAERILCDHYSAETALIFNSGFDANIGFFASVPQRTDVVFYDEYIHASIRDGIQMGNAKSYKYKHNDFKDLASTIDRQKGSRNPDTEYYVVTEAVFSMDGDSPDVSYLVSICKQQNCRLVIDEAHLILGSGNSQLDVTKIDTAKDVLFARIVTFGKAMGIQGAAILGSDKLKTYLVNFARSFVYTTALPPMSIAAIVLTHQILSSSQGEEHKKLLNRNIQCFNDEVLALGLQNIFITSKSAIHCGIIPGNDTVKKTAAIMQKHGFDVRPILAPTIPEGQERLRFCLHSYNTPQEIKEVLSILASAINREIHVR